jgi:hypothetical protein
MDINNLFDYCVESTTTINKTIFFVGDMIGNSLFLLAIDNDTNKIYANASEWLCLIKSFYAIRFHHYNHIVSQYNSIITSKNLDTSYADCNVIPFITSFSGGTVHGYSGLFCVLTEYINNFDSYKDYKIIVYTNSQQGLLDIITHFVDINIINKEQIIYISSNKQYLFNSIKFIPNSWNTFPRDIKLEIIDKYMIDNNKYLPHYNYDKICILKSSISDNKTVIGIVDIEIVNNFCNKNNLFLLEPTKINEIELINIINKSKIFVTTWGTAFFKNSAYISDNCEKIIVLVIGHEFMSQYNNAIRNNSIDRKIKNAHIEYYITDTNLNVDINIA